MEYKTINFQPIAKGTKLPDDMRVAVDFRNGIYCANPTLDIDCYINYIDYLNMSQEDWVSYGYLDLGMVPLVMLPSFFPQDVKDILSTAAQQVGIKVFPMPPVSHLKGSYKGTTSDVWVFREDLAEVLGCSYMDATLTNWLKQIKRYS